MHTGVELLHFANVSKVAHLQYVVHFDLEAFFMRVAANMFFDEKSAE